MDNAVAAETGTTLRLWHRFEATPERVFAAWTRPEALRLWWCPVGWRPVQIEVDLREAQLMGYRIAILPGMLLKTVYGACDAALAALKETHRHPTPLFDGSVRDGFRRFGADEWDALRSRFRDPPAPAAE